MATENYDVDALPFDEEDAVKALGRHDLRVELAIQKRGDLYL
jgi:hypothetical protein